MIYKMLQYILLFLVLVVVAISVFKGFAAGVIPVFILLVIARAVRPQAAE